MMTQSDNLVLNQYCIEYSRKIGIEITVRTGTNTIEKESYGTVP